MRSVTIEKDRQYSPQAEALQRLVKAGRATSVDRMETCFLPGTEPAPPLEELDAFLRVIPITPSEPNTKFRLKCHDELRTFSKVFSIATDSMLVFQRICQYEDYTGLAYQLFEYSQGLWQEREGDVPAHLEEICLLLELE